MSEGLEERLSTLPFVKRVVALRLTTSTNDEARALAAAGAPEGTVVVAEEQTAGRGRLGRSWHSPPGAGLYLSLILRPTESAELAGRYAIAAAVGVYEACRHLAGERVSIKWPNDVLGLGRKLAGILAESRGGSTGPELILGIGVNVLPLPSGVPEAIRAASTSLVALRDGAPVAREAVAQEVLARLGGEVALLRSGGWEGIVTRFLRYSPAAVGSRVRLATGALGVTRGLDEGGALRVETAAGMVPVHAADSVVPAEG